VLANSAPQQDAQSSFRSHLLAQQLVGLVRRPGAAASPFRFPEGLASEPILVPSLDCEIRLAFDWILERAGLRPVILAEVDDMAMLRLLARDSEGLPLIVVRDELASGTLVEVCRIRRSAGASTRSRRSGGSRTHCSPNLWHELRGGSRRNRADGASRST